VHRPSACCGDDCSSKDACERSAKADSAVCAGFDVAEGGEEDGASAEGLADLGGDGVCGRLGQGGQNQNRAHPRGVMVRPDRIDDDYAKRERERDGGAKIGDDLGGGSALRLSARPARAFDDDRLGLRIGEEEERDQRCKSRPLWLTERRCE